MAKVIQNHRTLKNWRVFTCWQAGQAELLIFIRRTCVWQRLASYAQTSVFQMFGLKTIDEIDDLWYCIFVFCSLTGGDRCEETHHQRGVVALSPGHVQLSWRTSCQASLSVLGHRCTQLVLARRTSVCARGPLPHVCVSSLLPSYCPLLGAGV